MMMIDEWFRQCGDVVDAIGMDDDGNADDGDDIDERFVIDMNSLLCIVELFVYWSIWLTV